MGVASQFYTPVCDNKVPSLVASLFSWRCLAASTSSFLHAAINLRPPSVTVSTHTSAFKAVAFQSPAMPNVRMSLCTQSVHSFSFPPRPLRDDASYYSTVEVWSTRDEIHTDAFRVVVVVVFFTLTDRASTIPSNIRGCQSGTWS